MTWLLVEDDNDIRNVIAVMMSVWGEKPLSFADGGAAWTWLDNVDNGTYTGELPELALMDIRMPGHTGDKVAARIRKVAALKDIAIILMTAFSLADSEIKEMVDQAGIDYLINKPLPDMEDFRAMLYRVRDDRKARVAKRNQAVAAAAASTAASAAPTTPATSAPAAPTAASAAPTISAPAAAPATVPITAPTPATGSTPTPAPTPANKPAPTTPAAAPAATDANSPKPPTTGQP